MEDMARLALVEQCVQDIDAFSKIMLELLRHIIRILDHPHDKEQRTINSKSLKDLFKLSTAFSDYLKYVGYQVKGDDIEYPKNLSLSHLRLAQEAIERKVSLCCSKADKTKSLSAHFDIMKRKVEPADCVKTKQFLVQIQSLFNNMLRYEDPELLAYAREQIPIKNLQLVALNRVREQESKIKSGEIKEKELSFEIALLVELMLWFKYEFFTWVDSPQCECGATTVLNGVTMQECRGERCRVEMYKCTACSKTASFPRFNDPRTLLDWRKGRCGEWANCFTLLCRALNYDVRYIYDVTDHVWCEVFDYDANTWLHCDPCEAKLNTPLMYSHGWGKQLSYVIGVSRDDLQDVTWRYTTNHKEVLKRRTKVSELELIDCLTRLRWHRQRQLSESRRNHLVERTAIELVNLMKERKPEEYESQGRISGSITWRQQRGEAGEKQAHIFNFGASGEHSVKYDCAKDVYRVKMGQTEQIQSTWAAGTYASNHVFRKVEHDWKQAYLARMEGATTGEVSWRFRARDGLICKQLAISLNTALYEDGKILWTVTFDDDESVAADLGAKPTEFERTFKSVTLRAVLSGGTGELAWQHAQLFRQSLSDPAPSFTVSLRVDTPADSQGDGQTNPFL